MSVYACKENDGMAHSRVDHGTLLGSIVRANHRFGTDRDAIQREPPYHQLLIGTFKGFEHIRTSKGSC